jgi:hypothetical protein
LGLITAERVPHSLFPPKKKRVYANISIYREMYMTDILGIEKDVPLTTKIRRYTYPYKDMDVGDSFFVADGKLPTINNANYRASKLLGWKFSARKQDGGIRVWRIL